MGEVLCSWNLVIDGFAQCGVDKTESSSRVADTSVTGALDDLSTYNSADSIDLPETAVVDNWSVEDCLGSNVGLIDVT